MSDFLNSIKVTDEEKKVVMSKLLSSIILYPEVLSLNEILEITENGNNTNKNRFLDLVREVKAKLNENEILATYSLAKKMKISILSSNCDEKLFKYLEWNMYSVNNDRLMEFINEIVEDIENTKRINENAKWTLQINKIMSRIDRKNEYDSDKVKENKDKKDAETTNKNSNIIDSGEYWSK